MNEVTSETEHREREEVAETSSDAKIEERKSNPFLAEIKKLKSILMEKDREIASLKEELKNVDSGRESWISEKKALMDEISRLKSELEYVSVSEKVKSVVASKGGNWKLLSPLIDRKVEIKEYGMFVKGTTKTLEEYLDELASDPDYAPAFQSSPLSKGGTVSGTPSVAGPNPRETIDNPFAKDKYNLTKQVELYTRDPHLALKLATIAGNVPDWLRRKTRTSSI